MTARVRAYAERFAALNDEFVAAVAGCGDERWRRPTAAEGWPVAVVAHHVAAVQGAFDRLLGALAAGETFTPTTSMEEVHANNARRAAAPAGVGQAETLALLRAHGAAIEATLRGLDDADLDRPAGTFGGHELTVGQVVERVVLGHVAEHLASLRATLAD